MTIITGGKADMSLSKDSSRNTSLSKGSSKYSLLSLLPKGGPGYIWPKRGRKKEPAVAPPVFEPWHDRHHICHSKDNARRPRHKRDYFDHLPGLRVDRGEYREVPKHHSAGVDTFAWTSIGDQTAQLEERFATYPITDFSVEWVDRSIEEEDSVSQSEVSEATTSFAINVSTAPTKNSIFQDPVPLDLLAAAVGLPGSTGSLQGLSSTIRNELAHDGVHHTPGKRHSGAKNPGTQFKNTQSEALFLNIAGHEAIQEFFKWSRKKYGGPVQMWKALDSSSDLILSRAEFFKGLADLKYQGDVKALWKLLDRDHSNSVSFLHFHPEGALNLALFKKWATDVFGSVEEMGRAIDYDRNGKLSLAEFKDCCQKYNFHPDSATVSVFRICGHLGKKTGDGEVILSSMTFLDRWDCPEYLWMPPDQEHWEQWKVMMLHKHKGNALAAWLKTLDRDGSMRVNFLEFKTACKYIHDLMPEMNIPGIWRAIDVTLKGWLSLREFDQKTYEDLKKLKEFAVSAHGSVQRLLESMVPKGAKVPRPVFRIALKKSGVYDQQEPAPDTAEEAKKETKRDRRRRTTLAEKETEQIDMMFTALDVDGKGSLVPRDVRFLDEWNIEEEEAEETAWAKLSEMRQHRNEEEEFRQTDSESLQSGSRDLASPTHFSTLQRPHSPAMSRQNSERKLRIGNSAGNSAGISTLQEPHSPTMSRQNSERQLLRNPDRQLTRNSSDRQLLK